MKIVFGLYAFVVELLMLAAVGYWGYRQGGSMLLKFAIAAVSIGVFVVLWAIWIAPRSRYRLEIPSRIILESLLLFASVFMVYQTGHRATAFWFAVIVVIREIIALLYKE